MPEFVNTMDVLGEGAVIDSIFKRTITELKDNRITKVGQYAFYKCTALEEVDLPNATKIIANAFEGCTALSSANFPKLTQTEGNAFKGCTALTEIDLPEAVNIGGASFNGCKNLTSVNLPKADTVQDSAFLDCKALTYIDLPCLSALRTGVFQGCTLLKALVLRRTSGVVTMANANALNYTAIANGEGYVYVPTALYDSYLTADKWSTYANQFRKLEEWTVDGTVTGELDLENRHMVRFFHYDGTLLSYVIVPHGGSAVYEGDNPTRPNTSVSEDFEFTGWSPEPVNVIADMDCIAQFKNNASMARALLEGTIIGNYTNDRVTSVGAYAFVSCANLTGLDFALVTEIGANAFNGCSNLDTLILRSETVCTLANTNAFTGTKIASGTGYIYVPSALVDNYKAASNWSAFQFRAIEDYPDICGGE